MKFTLLASTDVHELTKARSAGKPINTHVVIQPKPLRPNYEEMQRIVNPQVKDMESLPVER